MSTKSLSRRQARWSQFLSRFDFKVVYRPRKSSTKPDALTRRSGDFPKEGDERLTSQNQVVLKPHNLIAAATEFPEPAPVTPESGPETEPELDQTPLEEPEQPEGLWDQGYHEDPIPNEVLQALRQGI